MLIVWELKSLGFPKGLAFPVRLATWALLYEADPIELDINVVPPLLDERKVKAKFEILRADSDIKVWELPSPLLCCAKEPLKSVKLRPEPITALDWDIKVVLEPAPVPLLKEPEYIVALKVPTVLVELDIKEFVAFGKFSILPEYNSNDFGSAWPILCVNVD